MTGATWSRAMGLRVARVRDYGSGSVELRDLDNERLVVGAGSLAQEIQGDRFTEKQGRIGITAPVDTGVNAVSEADVVTELIEFAIDGELAGISARVG